MPDDETTIFLDKNGQPFGNYNLLNNQKKAINVLYGLLIGLTADGVVNDREIMALKLWLDDNKQYHNLFPIDVVKKRIDDILADGIITDPEKQDLCGVLSQIIGGNLQETGAMGGLSTRYGMDEIENLIIQHNVFCFTGAFAYGPRTKCEQAIAAKGGRVINTITLSLDYLVVGGLSSRDWIGTSHGRKIEAAKKLKESGQKIKILPEEIWIKHL